MKNVLDRNRQAWNRQVEKGNQWTIPFSAEVIAKARQGEWSVLLTPEKTVPREWFPNMKGLKVLALASGGGQQGPIFAAAGADVTVYDLSPNQLARDREVAERENLQIKTVEGDMMDLKAFADETFDFIFHPCSNCFVPDVKRVWKEAFRVLKPGGTMISGVVNPVNFTYDIEKEKQGVIEMKYKIPYSDLTSITEEERVRLFGEDEPLCFGHTLQDLLGGQMEAGFHLVGFFEDGWSNQGPINNFIDVYIATRALKPKN